MIPFDHFLLDAAHRSGNHVCQQQNGRDHEMQHAGPLLSAHCGGNLAADAAHGTRRTCSWLSTACNLRKIFVARSPQKNPAMDPSIDGDCVAFDQARGAVGAFGMKLSASKVFVGFGPNARWRQNSSIRFQTIRACTFGAVSD
jgi:hypothetical protein